MRRYILSVLLITGQMYADVLSVFGKDAIMISRKSYPLCRVAMKDLKFFPKSEAIEMLLSKGVYEGKIYDIDRIVIKGNLHNVDNADKILLKCFKTVGCDALKVSENAKKSFLHAQILLKNPTLSLSQLNHYVGKINENIMTKYFQSTGWTKIEGEVGRNGIDGLFVKKSNGVIKDVLVVESKYNKSTLKETAHGQQMTQEWVVKKVNNLIKKYPNNDEYREIKRFIDNDTYRSLLWKLKVDDNKLIISLQKIHDKEGRVVTSNLQGSSKMKINYAGNQEIDLKNPQNDFHKKIISWYTKEINSIK